MRRLGPCCNCGSFTPEVGFCGCGFCRQAASVTLSPIIVPRQFKDINGVVQTTMVQVYDGGTIPFNEESIDNTDQLGTQTCYYGADHTAALDDTARWGVSPFGDLGGTCWSEFTFNPNFDRNYYFGANIVVRHVYNSAQRSYINVAVGPRFYAASSGPPDFVYSKGADASGVFFGLSFNIEQDFDYQGPYRECEGPAYSTDAASCHGAATASLNYSDPEPSLCECWSNENGGGCQFDSVSPFSNMILDLDNQPTRTQNAPSYWDFGLAGPFIVVPMDDGFNREFFPIPDQLQGFNGIGAGKYISLGEDGSAGSVPFSLDACEGNIQGNGFLNPNHVFTVDVTNGSDCQ